MKDFLREYKNINEERMNFSLMNRDYDDDLNDFIANSCKSLEVLSYIKFLGYRYVDDERKIDLNDYITTRKKSRKKTGIKYMHMQDSRYVELQLRFKVSCKDEEDIITKKLLIPVANKDGYYTIKGKKYFLMYQLVDASTYTTRQNLTLKSLMPVTVKRSTSSYADIDGNEHEAPVYTVYIFRKEVDILLLYFSKFGVSRTLEAFGVHTVMGFTEKPNDPERNIYFPISSKVFLGVDRYFFEKFQYVQSVAMMILRKDVVSNRLNIEDLEDKEHWVSKLGSMSTTTTYNYYEKGLNTLTFFDRMLDENTKRILKIAPQNKRSIYTVIRWMIQNFNELRKKDNLDLVNKRLRCNEYIAALLTKAFSDRLNRIIASGKNVDIKKVKDIFKFPGDIIMQELYKSGLLRYDDKINDMDFFSKLRFTLKGPNALGSKNENNISIKYRGLHPSYLGRIDINVCGTSDPGSSGLLTPFCETDGLYFDGAAEPEDGVFDFEKEAHQKYKEKHDDRLIIDLYDRCENIQDFFKTRKKIMDDVRQMQILEIPKKQDIYRIKIDLDAEDEEI